MKPSRTSAGRSASYRAKNPAQTFGVSVDVDALDEMLNDISDTLDANVRPAAQAGAEVLYQAVLRNVRAIGRKTGNLESSIYQAFSERHSHQTPTGYDVATYQVSWNPRKAPHAHLVEFGHMQKFKVYLGKDGKWYTNKKAPLPSPIQIAARPFIRPAMASFGEAQAAMEQRLVQGLS